MYKWLGRENTGEKKPRIWNILFLHLYGGYGWVFIVPLLRLFLDPKYVLF